MHRRGRVMVPRDNVGRGLPEGELEGGRPVVPVTGSAKSAPGR